MYFIQLIASHPNGVEIPLLQRDYAQGRGDEAPRTAQVRADFLGALHKALSAPAENPCPAHLDFIYGEVREEAFEPIDGQQRLTTLFLIHWYLAAVSGHGENFKELLLPNDSRSPRFRYAMRPASERFFTRLLAHHADIGSHIASANTPSAQIKDRTWFLDDWLHDPTVRGALVMLDAIARKFAADQGRFATYYESLTSENAPITFEVLTLSSFGQGDDIYVKMNARGKSLTEFEKFKAWLIRHCGDALTPKHQQKMDNDWLEFFWRHSPQKSDPKPTAPYDRADHVSRVFFRTVLALAVNYHAKNKNNDESVKDWLRDKRTPRLEESRDEWARLFPNTMIGHILVHVSANLNQLLKLPLEGDAPTFTDPKFFAQPAAFLTRDASQPLTLGMGLWLHALGLFAEHFKHSSALTSPKAQEWLRIVRNLLENTGIEAENYARIIRGLDALAAHMGDEPERLANLTEAEIAPNKIPGLDHGQLKEEVRKARLRNDSANGVVWLPFLNAAEDHDLLRGQIEFLLGETTPLESIACPETFSRRWRKFGERFPEGAESRDNLNLIRAALARCEPINLHEENTLELVLPATDTDWRAIFQRSQGAQKAFQRGCSRLLDTWPAKEQLDSPAESFEIRDSHPAWMRCIVRHGKKLWENRQWRKVRSRNLIFLYKNPSHRNHVDDLGIDEIAELRNQLIEALLKSLDWVLPNAGEKAWNQDWRRIECASGVVFYRGHHIILRRKSRIDPASVIECIFGYHELTLRLSSADGASSASLVIPYLKDASLAIFSASLEAEAQSQRESAPDAPLTKALADIARLATELAPASSNADPLISATTESAPATA